MCPAGDRKKKKKRYMDKRRWFWREGVIGGAVVWGGDAISDRKEEGRKSGSGRRDLHEK